MASSMVAMSTDDMGLAAEILRDDEMDMRFELDIDECDDRADAADEGEMDRGVEMSELEVLWAYDAMACARAEGERKAEGSRVRRAREYIHGARSRQGCARRCRWKRVPCGVTLVVSVLLGLLLLRQLGPAVLG